jgi:hypothetical protein
MLESASEKNNFPAHFSMHDEMTWDEETVDLRLQKFFFSLADSCPRSLKLKLKI